jgi:hypothetical protein
VAKVIDLNRRKKLKQDLGRTEKLTGLRSLLQCNTCGMRCSKCGVHGDPISRVTHPGTGVAFVLCPSCLDEYSDLLSYLDADGEHDDRPSWYNREWVRQWLAWLDYQWAMNNYLSSPEVLAVITELEDED